MQVLVVNGGAAPVTEIGEFLKTSGFDVEVIQGLGAARKCAQHAAFDAMLLSVPGPTDTAGLEAFNDLMHIADTEGVAAIVLGRPPVNYEHRDYRIIDFTVPDAGKEEIRGRIATIVQYQRILRAMERDMDNMQRLFKQLNIQFNQVDQEMRLAGRLQRDFLPRSTLTVGNVVFSALFRPASFVSGDIYDMMRVDEDHVGFYVADAVGHGMAASLLTMFIKNAIVSKTVSTESYRVLAPDETLRQLNEKLCNQQLPNSQFVTCTYALMNTRTLELQYARAGHPYPLLHSTCAKLVDLKSPGSLLGLFEGEEFPTRRVTLKPGEKVMLFSDGFEVAFAADQPGAGTHLLYRDVLSRLSHLPGERLVSELSLILDNEAGSLNPKDDLTLLVMDVNEPR